MNNLILNLITFFVFSNLLNAQTIGSFTDSRDGQTYQTVTFENSSTDYLMTWMAENLNYLMSESYAYNNDEKLRDKYGLLYSWPAANNACPNGWHLPSEKEWETLVIQVGGEELAGQALKSDKDWDGTNSSGFNALPAGFIGKTEFVAMDNATIFWSSTIESPQQGKTRAVRTNDNWISSGYSGFQHCVRCVQD